MTGARSHGETGLHSVRRAILKTLHWMMIRVLGGEPESATRSLSVAVAVGAMARSLVVSFGPIWAVSQLHATNGEIALAYATGGAAAAGGGFIGGVSSDRYGGRTTLIIGWIAQAGIAAVFYFSSDIKILGLALIALTTFFASLCAAASQALAAQLASDTHREEAFANLRIGQNVGFALGPPVGGALLVLGWPILFLGLTIISGTTVAVINAVVPEPEKIAPGHAPRVRGAWRILQYDRRLQLLFAAGCLAMMVYAAEAVLLPISLTQSHGISPSIWGALALVNPLLIVVLQMRVVRIVALFPIAPRLSGATLLMGLPFLLLAVSDTLGVILLVILLFVVGEVAWAPGAQKLMADIAPEGSRGTYLGLFAATLPIGTAFGPLVGLQARSEGGDTGMWLANAAVAVLAACVYAIGGLMTQRNRAKHR